MGTEEGTDESENGKAELTTDTRLGSSGGRERSNDNGDFEPGWQQGW